MKHSSEKRNLHVIDNKKGNMKCRKEKVDLHICADCKAPDQPVFWNLFRMSFPAILHNMLHMLKNICSKGTIINIKYFASLL